jgi:hypothetical protein
LTGALADLSAVPFHVGALTSFDEWRVATLYYLLRAPDLEMFFLWSPTFLSGLLEGIDAHRNELLALFQRGGRLGGRDVPNDTGAAERFSSFESENTAALWPDLKLISCWTDGGPLRRPAGKGAFALGVPRPSPA